MRYLKKNLILLGQSIIDAIPNKNVFINKYIYISKINKNVSYLHIFLKITLMKSNIDLRMMHNSQ